MCCRSGQARFCHHRSRTGHFGATAPVARPFDKRFVGLTPILLWRTPKTTWVTLSIEAALLKTTKGDLGPPVTGRRSMAASTEGHIAQTDV